MDKALEQRDLHMKVFTPREIVSELDKYIVGQNNAKRSVGSPCETDGGDSRCRGI